MSRRNIKRVGLRSTKRKTKGNTRKIFNIYSEKNDGKVKKKRRVVKTKRKKKILRKTNVSDIHSEFLSIPNEVYFLIISYMDFKTILFFRFVSNRFFELFRTKQVNQFLEKKHRSDNQRFRKWIFHMNRAKKSRKRDKNGRRVSDLKLPTPSEFHRLDFSTDSTHERPINAYLKPDERKKVERIGYVRHKNRLFFILLKKAYLPDSIVFTPTTCKTKFFLYMDLGPSPFGEDRRIGLDKRSFKISDRYMNKLISPEEVNEFKVGRRYRKAQFTKNGIIKIGFRLARGNKLVRYGGANCHQDEMRKRYKEKDIVGKKDYGSCVVHFNIRTRSVWILSQGSSFVKDSSGRWM